MLLAVRGHIIQSCGFESCACQWAQPQHSTEFTCAYPRDNVSAPLITAPHTQVSVAVLLDNFLSASNQICKEGDYVHYLEQKQAALVSKAE